MTQFTQPDDDHQHAGQVMIELRVGNACDRPFPSKLRSSSRRMFVAGDNLFMCRWLPLFMMLRP
jgi:hypothetical protein